MAKIPNQRTVHLATAIARGAGDKQQKITKVTLRKPVAGELRGLKLLDVIQLDVGALITLLPRISDPGLTEAEVAAMDAADLTELGLEVSGFLSGSQPSPPG